MFEFLKDENILILALGDGVGSSPCDWKASALSCELFITHFKAQKSVDILERIKNAVFTANENILLESGSCEGMKSTLSIVVWDVGESKIHYTSIGDSRIYEWTSTDEVNQLSKDEVQSVILKKRDGKPMVIAGTVVVAEGITNVIGSPFLKFNILSKSTKHTRGVALSSDGFHGLFSNANEKLKHLLNNINLDKSIDRLMDACKVDQKDDMTLLLGRVKLSDEKKDSIINVILEESDLASFNNYELSTAILTGLENNISSRSKKNVNLLLNAVGQNKIELDKEHITSLISLMIRKDFQDQSIYQELRKLLGVCRH